MISAMEKSASSEHGGTRSPADVGPPPGFGKNLYDDLNLYVRVVDTRVRVQLGLSGAVLAYLSVIDASKYGGSASIIAICQPLGLLLQVLSITFALYAMRPGAGRGEERPRGKEYAIFWEDIGSLGSHGAYIERLKRTDALEIERQYAIGNYYMSKIMTRKFEWLRRSYRAFVAGGVPAAVVLVCSLHEKVLGGLQNICPW
ncbi:MAG: hypothetical protein GY953_54430 [bacterium]|nr:hypothetical protein [bacterium]